MVLKEGMKLSGNRRRSNGEETRYRLLDWIGGQTPAERLGSHILRAEGYKSIDPSHPLGGRDGLKDIICFGNGIQWIAACFFPRGKKTFREIKKKFSEDLEGVVKNNVKGYVFITNQEITLAERNVLRTSTQFNVDIFHQERIVGILNSPYSYGARLEYLDINMTVEELISYSYYYLNALNGPDNSIKYKKDSDSHSLNPSCGSAGFLLAINKENSNQKNIEIKSESQEINSNSQYDVIIANPLFVSNKNLGSSSVKELQLINNELNTLYKTVISLKPNGISQAAVVLTDSALKDNSGKGIRRELLDKCNLHTILRLPDGFSKRLQEKMNILFFTREEKEINNTNEVWIYDIRRISLENDQPMESIFKQFFDEYKAKNFQGANWTVTSIEEIKRRDYNLDFNSL